MNAILGPLPVGPFTVIAFAVGAGVLLLYRWLYVRGLWHRRQRAGDGAAEPDRVWSAREGGPWIVTFRGEVYEIWADDLPKGRELPKGLMSDEVFGMIAGSQVTQEAPFNRTARFEHGDLIAARLARNTSDADSVPWRIDALDRERAYILFGFEDEQDARNVLELLRRRVLPPESAAAGGASDDVIDAARRRDEEEEAATERQSRKRADPAGTGSA